MPGSAHELSDKEREKERARVLSEQEGQKEEGKKVKEKQCVRDKRRENEIERGKPWGTTKQHFNQKKN